MYIYCKREDMELGRLLPPDEATNAVEIPYPIIALTGKITSYSDEDMRVFSPYKFRGQIDNWRVEKDLPRLILTIKTKGGKKDEKCMEN